MRKHNIFTWVGILLIGAAAVGWWTWNRPITQEPIPAPTTPPPQLEEQVIEDDLPYDKLFITPQRQKYINDSLVLKIPRLDIDTPVENGTDLAALKRGPGLYEYAQLPGEGNRNVSIAGHRDIHGNIFYYLDQLHFGDLFYLLYEGEIYRYAYLDTTVVEQDDWGPIYSQGFSCLTLTTCEPIGVSDHRLIIRAQLLDHVPEQDGYYYAPTFTPLLDLISSAAQSK